ncbi:MAG: hypothetical protein ACP5UT_08910 [Bryobacteraceae bacterium]
MFTWICPVCGAEVPPSEPECPRCAERRRAALAQQPPAQPAASPQAGAPPAYAPAVPAQPAAYSAPPVPPPIQQASPPQQPSPTGAWQAPPQPATYAGQTQPVYVIGEHKPRRAVPAWLAAVLTIAVLGGGLFALYRYISAGSSRQQAGEKAAPFERPSAQGSAHPFAKYLEVTGIRLLENREKKLVMRFVVVNHAPADLSGFRLRITLEAANAQPGDAMIAVVDAAPGTLPAYGIREMEAPVVTHLKVYELPDWQFLRARTEIIDAK